MCQALSLLPLLPLFLYLFIYLQIEVTFTYSEVAQILGVLT